MMWDWLKARVAALRESVWPAVAPGGGETGLYPPPPDLPEDETARRMRGHAAKAVLESAPLTQAFDRVERSILAAWLATAIDDAALRERLWAQAQALRHVREDLAREARLAEPTPTMQRRYASATRSDGAF